MQDLVCKLFSEYLPIAMDKVKPKKHLGQHFLKDENISLKIVEAFRANKEDYTCLEIGPGMGVLTRHLLKRHELHLFVAEIDKESVAYLQQHYPDLSPNILEGDFLQMPLQSKFNAPWGIIGNFPYNISSQIFFKILDLRQEVDQVVCMLQKEVAQRIASGPGTKDYGILSVLLQAYYDISYLFTVEPGAFIPPPKVRSGVIRLVRNSTQHLDCDEVLFKRIVKQGFNNRRKTLRNALKALNLPESMLTDPMLDKRAEQLHVADYIYLTQKLEKLWKN